VPIPPATSTDCPAVSDGGGSDAPTRRLGADGRCACPVALPRTLPRPFWACHPTGRRSPHSLRTPAGDPTPITQVKGMYSGEIESRSRPGYCDSRPGNAISRELTSLIDNHTNTSSPTLNQYQFILLGDTRHKCVYNLPKVQLPATPLLRNNVKAKELGMTPLSRDSNKNHKPDDTLAGYKDKTILQSHTHVHV